MKVLIRAGDDVLRRYGNQLGALGGGQAARIMAMALNTEGNKGRTRVRRALMEQTGIKSHQIGKAMKTIRASSGRLQYRLDASGYHSNISMFGLKVAWKKVASIKSRRIDTRAGQGMKLQEVSSSPWHTSRIFPHVFSIAKYGKRVFIRTTDKRTPFRAVHGPNIATELVKAQSRAQFETIAPQVGIEVGRLLGLVMSGAMKLGGTREFARD